MALLIWVILLFRDWVLAAWVWVDDDIAIVISVISSSSPSTAFNSTDTSLALFCPMSTLFLLRCMASTTWAVVATSFSITCSICSVVCWVLKDRLRTSSATTAKPRPCSPARAASMAALSASKLVCEAILLILAMALAISSIPLASESTCMEV